MSNATNATNAKDKDAKDPTEDPVNPTVDPRLCCAARICCDNPEAARRDLAAAMVEGLWGSNVKGGNRTLAESHAEHIAGWILDHFDLVPKGVGTMIATAYRPLFAAAIKGGHKRPGGSWYATGEAYGGGLDDLGGSLGDTDKE